MFVLYSLQFQVPLLPAILHPSFKLKTLPDLCPTIFTNNPSLLSRVRVKLVLRGWSHPEVNGVGSDLHGGIVVRLPRADPSGEVGGRR